MEKTMPSKENGAPAVATQDGPNIKLNASKPIEPSPTIQRAIAALQRDFAAEALRIAAIKAAHASDDVLLGDDPSAERAIRLAISHLRAGAAAFRELQNSHDGCLHISGENAR
jgi:hypothetical protein